MTEEQEQADAAATWDQVEAILDGFSVTNPRPGAKRVADLVAEVERLRAEVAAERAAVVSALERWAEDGGDPWMSYCAERVKSGEHRHEEDR